MPTLTMEELLAIPGLTRGGGDASGGECRKRKVVEEHVLEVEEEWTEEDVKNERERPDQTLSEMLSAAADAAAPKSGKRAKSGGSEARATSESVVIHHLDKHTVMGVLKVSARMVGSVVGKGGWFVKELESTTGVTMAVEEDSPLNVGIPARDMEVTGTPAQVAAACRMIVAQVDEISGGDESSEPEARNKFLIGAPELIGALVGQKGRTIKAIRQLTGAAVDLLEEVGVGTFACVAGTNEAVAEATTMVHAVMGSGDTDDKDSAHEYALGLQARAQQQEVFGEGNGGEVSGGAEAAEGGGTLTPAEAAAAEAAEYGAWRTVTSQHPDGTPIYYYHNVATGQSQFEAPQAPTAQGA